MVIYQGLVPTVIRRAQAVAASAVALSGVSLAELMSYKLNSAWITCTGNALRYSWDANNPSGTAGHVLPVNTPLQINGQGRIVAFRMIGDAGAAVVVTFTLDNYTAAGGMV